MMQKHIKLTKKSVNSKILFDEIHSFIADGIFSVDVAWSNENHRLSLIDIFDEFLDDLFVGNKIDQWNVFCDQRNNSIPNMNAGKYVLEIQYKQHNCLNLTRLIYEIDEQQISNPSDT